jgi:hypothetical protein
MQRNLSAAGIAFALAAPAVTLAASKDDLTAIRQQIEQLKQDYERRIKELEARLERAEAVARQAQAAAEQAQAAPSAVPAAPALTAGGGFNPAMGVILQGTYAALSLNPKNYTISGFDLGADTRPGERGFSLGESELNLNANVDDWFFGNFTAAVGREGSIDVEEAYFQTLALPYGLGVKGGRFFSAIGYLNQQHQHAWDFYDPPLAYRAMLDNQYGDDGVQLRWVAPTELYLALGGELFRGDAFPAGGAANNGVGSKTAFVHVGGDVGDSNSWTAGASYLQAQADNRQTSSGVFTGTTDLAVADFVWKWAPHGDPSQKNLKLQSEYLWSNPDGTFNGIPYSGRQRGWYAQAVYQFIPRWRVGYRHDQLNPGSVSAALQGTVLDSEGHQPTRDSLMIDFSNSEFSRIRLQYNRDLSSPQVDNEWFVQYIMSLGAHGAHQF